MKSNKTILRNCLAVSFLCCLHASMVFAQTAAMAEVELIAKGCPMTYINDVYDSHSYVREISLRGKVLLITSERSNTFKRGNSSGRVQRITDEYSVNLQPVTVDPAADYQSPVPTVILRCRDELNCVTTKHDGEYTSPYPVVVFGACNPTAQASLVKALKSVEPYPL